MNEDYGTTSADSLEDGGAPYETKWSRELGRYLVAVRDIKEREIIIREDPLISGPSDRGPKEIPVCLGCSCVMYENPINRCTNCHWPVCNTDCEKLLSHSSNECKLFRKNHVTYPPPYGHPSLSKSIFILRCLLLKTESPVQWGHLMKMSDNDDIRQGKPTCIHADKKILENFEKFYPVEGDSQGFSEKEVIRISGITDTNAHAFPLKVNERATTVCNLYSKTSLIAHSCTPNASWSPDKSLSSLTLTIRANTHISKGSMISVAYDEGQLLSSTLKRLIPNEINGMFICKCERCLDPTELGTYIGALKCPRCEQGYLLPIDPVDSFSSWKCDNSNRVRNDAENSEKEETGSESTESCNLVLSDETVTEIIEDAEMMCGYTKMNLGVPAPQPETRTDSPEDDETLELLKEFESIYGDNVLHPNHYILQEVSVRILKMEYGKGLGSMSNPDLISFLERCERLLAVADVLTPGFCEYRAFLQFHFSQGLLALERRKEGKSQERKQRRRQDQCKIKPRSALTTTNAIAVSVKGEKRDRNKEMDGDDAKSGTARQQCGSSVNGSDSENCKNAGGEALPRKETVEKPPTKSYGDSLSNLKRIKEMLTFLIVFFKEINSSHKLLQPISETLEEAEMKLKKKRT